MLAKQSEVTKGLCVMYLGEQGAAGCVVAWQGRCWGVAGSHKFRHRQCQGGMWLVLGAGVTPSCKLGLFHRNWCWKFKGHIYGRLLKAINYKDYLAPRKYLPPSAGASVTYREYLCRLICPYSLPLPAAISHCQKTGPRVVTPVLVQLCHCYMASLWHCSSNKIEVIVERVQSSRRNWKRSLELGMVTGGSMGLAEEGH